ncbi:hypothetical protein [Microvirga zambiensis]|uniref:hypothetical protein n=1 Tax=Microvirga zambiensis TaxID=1402137 RepID=UPI0031B5A52B
MREERLRATAGLRSSSTLSSWRGHSGRRYIVGVHALNEAELLDVTDAVILAVKRDRTGTGMVIDAAMAAADPSEEIRLRWLKKAQGRGATELHIHRLAATEADRRAIFEDLRENETQGS